MANLPSDFDWQGSPSHLELLSKFMKPHDANNVATWWLWKQILKEDAMGAIQRFLQQGLLIDATLSESLNVVFTAAQLKKILKEHGLKQTGSKEELSDRLAEAHIIDARNLLGRALVVKCSIGALEMVSEFEQRRQNWLGRIKLQTYNALLKGETKEAYRLRVQFNREFPESQIRVGPLQSELIDSLLTSHPTVLDPISLEHLTALRAATGMSILWNDEFAQTWLPTDFVTHLRNAEVASNFLKANARIKNDLRRVGDRPWSSKISLEFNSGDVDSCDQCVGLHGQTFTVADMPELPMRNCTSDTGCNCYIRPVYDFQTQTSFIHLSEGSEEVSEQDARDGEHISIQADPTSTGVRSPVLRLMQLKQLLDQQLITHDEYEQKKKEILSAL